MGWNAVEDYMDINSEFDACLYIRDEAVNKDLKDENVIERHLFDKGEKVSDLDLELAAEIGKALLERNRELELMLKIAYESKEEESLKNQFLENQVETLKESLENQTKICEQFEHQILELNDKYMQLQIDYKTLSNKNARFWETIETLEQKCEGYKYKIEVLEEEKTDVLEKEILQKLDTDQNEKLQSDDDYESSLLSNILELEGKIDNLQETIKELRIQQGMDNIEKDELKAELEDVSTENQLLQHQVSLLESEIEEWKAVSEKAQRYKKLAEKYYPSHDTQANVGLPSKQPKQKTLTNKASSHEVLCDSPLCGASDLLETKQKYLSLSVTHLNQPPKSLSVLSEMDSQYHSLVKRYETLLNKYKHETATGGGTSEKVQRAIQTLSWDFSDIDHQSSLEEEVGTEEQTCFDDGDTSKESHIDFRKLFVDIFAKLKESKDFHPEKLKKDSK